MLDLEPEEVLYLCRRAVRLKHAPSAPRTLRGRTVGVYFRRTSTRTRTGFMVGAGRLGATTVHFGPGDLQTDTGETPEDTARVLAGYLDVLVMRTGESVEETHDPDAVEAGFDVVYTSRWQEMGVGKPDPEWKARLAPFRVTASLVDRVSGPGTVFMHDLPAVRGEDVDDEVLDGPRSLAWVQAQHKMWSAMAVMEWCGAGAVDDGT